jgi:nicotinate phosphoribosyltransferase
MEQTAVFEFFVRKFPAQRNFLVAAGLEQVLHFLENVRFTPAELDWIAGHGAFRPEFVSYLEKFRFTGEVHAMAEGTVFFPNEPILRVTAPIAEAQLVESRLINLLHFQTLIASKAARSKMAPDKLLRISSAPRLVPAGLLRAGELSRRFCRQRHRVGGAVVRRAGVRHHGALVCPGARR